MAADKRKAKRRNLSQDGRIYTAHGEPIAACQVRNVSTSGAQLELTAESEMPKHFVLALSHDGRVQRKCQLVWQFATVVGVRFEF